MNEGVQFDRQQMIRQQVVTVSNSWAGNCSADDKWSGVKCDSGWSGENISKYIKHTQGALWQ